MVFVKKIRKRKQNWFLINLVLLLGVFFVLAFALGIAFVFLVGNGDGNFLGIKIVSENETIAPSDFISENQIVVLDDKVVIYVDNARISKYAPTGSMKPTLDFGSNGISIFPKSPEEIYVGDLITFKDGDRLILHRVIEIGDDRDGKYYITKGDNNITKDRLIRFGDVVYKTIGLIY